MDEMESTAEEGNESISSNITNKGKKNDSQVIDTQSASEAPFWELHTFTFAGQHSMYFDLKPA